MKVNGIVKRTDNKNRVIKVEKYTIENDEPQDYDFFEKFHEIYKVVERSSMIRTVKVKTNVREASKNNSQCSTKRGIKTAKSSQLKPIPSDLTQILFAQPLSSKLSKLKNITRKNQKASLKITQYR